MPYQPPLLGHMNGFYWGAGWSLEVLRRAENTLETADFPETARDLSCQTFGIPGPEALVHTIFICSPFFGISGAKGPRHICEPTPLDHLHLKVLMIPGLSFRCSMYGWNSTRKCFSGPGLLPLRRCHWSMLYIRRDLPMLNCHVQRMKNKIVCEHGDIESQMKETKTHTHTHTHAHTHTQTNKQTNKQRGRRNPSLTHMHIHRESQRVFVPNVLTVEELLWALPTDMHPHPHMSMPADVTYSMHNKAATE